MLPPGEIPTAYKLSMTSYGMEQPFGQFGSTILAVPPPSFLCTWRAGKQHIITIILIPKSSFLKSEKPSPSPAEHSTPQLEKSQGTCSQALGSAEGSGHVSGEMQLCCARAQDAEQATPALDHRALRAEALLGGRREQGSCSEEGVCIAWDDRELSKFSLP